MCGLVGGISQKNVMPLLIDGLKRLEYRGYDSAGLAHAAEAGLKVHRCVGKVADLEKCLDGIEVSSTLGIGHTRWATHGEPSERNAHPHVSHDDIAVVHNGIIENHEALKASLIADGYAFSSDTDTEVIAHLVHRCMRDGSDTLFKAVQCATRDLKGAYAIAVIAVSQPDVIVVARHDSPLVVGVGDEGFYVASDPLALAAVTKRFIFPVDGDVLELRRGELNIADREGHAVKREAEHLDISADRSDKGPFAHYMLKEIHEQPQALVDTLEGHVAGDLLLEKSLGFKAGGLLDKIRSIHIVACGTSSHAGEVARYWLESLARIPTTVEVASEYRYREPVVPPDCLFVSLSQSGETADTVAALRYAKNAGYLTTLAVCNVPQSTLVRESDMTLLTRAGPEIGVASTKAFTTQLLSMLMLTLLLARRPTWDMDTERKAVTQMTRLGRQLTELLQKSAEIAALAARIANYRHALFLGRGPLFPIAKEGALKLKETSYIHAEAYAAGELKHGPLALIDREMPVIALAPSNTWLDKLKSNLREVQARGGELFVITDRDSGIKPEAGLTVFEMPPVGDLLSPISYTVVLQLLAYCVATIKGTDVDKPRNLAKSVTVE